MRRRSLLLGSIILVLAGCGQDPSPQRPFIVTDRNSLGFGLEYGSGAYIGTQVSDTIRIDNDGLEPLVISSVELKGDPAFTRQGPDKTEVPGRKYAFVTVHFKPTQERDYSGQLIINSNADNEPAKVITLSGRGVKPPPAAP